MRSSIRAAFATALALASALSAQTTGVPGYNDFRIAGFTPGATSCPFIGPLAPGSYNFTVDTAPGASVVLVINFNCPCTPCTVPFPPTPTPCPIPFTACGATTNQSLDLNPGFPGCTFIAVPMPVANAFGLSVLPIALPPTIRFGAQTGVAGLPCMTGGGFPIMWSQGYQVSTI